MKPETIAFLRKRRLWIACWALGIFAVALVAAKLAFSPSPDIPNDPRLVQARQDLRGLAGALGVYLIDHGRYPTQEEGLVILLHEGIIHQIPKDPWGHAYEYFAIGDDPRDFRLRFLGADGREGGVGINSDIVLETEESGPRYVLTDETGRYTFSQQYDIR